MQSNIKKAGSNLNNLFQQALTEEGVLLGWEDSGASWLSSPQPFPCLATNKATSNFSSSTPLGRDPPRVGPALQPWSAGNRCCRHTRSWQALQKLLFEKVNTALHRLTGQVGFFFFSGSQWPELSCCCSAAFSASPSQPVVSMEAEHVGHTTTFLSVRPDFGQAWDL